MTLAVALRVPDGLIIAADSLSTTRGQIAISAEITGRCPNCKKDVALKDISIPPIPIPASVSSFAQKVFPFKKHYGIATFGIGIINEKTIYYHVKTLEKENEKISSVTEVKEILEKYFAGEIRKQIKDIDKAPDDFSPLGFLLVGYDGDIGKAIMLGIGKKPKVEIKSATGCSIGGDAEVVSKLWELKKTDPRRGPNYASFSLQDAVDYAKFLINVTADFQRFANMIPSVGGEVDIGLITPFRPFTWIQCKNLTKTLEREAL